MQLNRKRVLIGLIVLIAALLFIGVRHHHDSSEASSALSTRGKPTQWPDPRHNRGSRGDDEEGALSFIRDQFALLLSDQPELAFLEKTLAACGRLKSTSSVIALLGHAELGWKPLAPDSLTGDSSHRSMFAWRVHEALFMRWGELDFDGAFNRLRPMGLFGYPKDGPGDYDEYWSPTTYLFKGAATIDGKHAFDVLDEMSRFSVYQEIALGPLMEGWARSDPAAAWDTLTSHPSMANGTLSIQGYFKGLSSNTSWPDMREKVEAICASPQLIGGVGAMAEFHRSLAKAWIHQDPAAALAWYAPYSLEPAPGCGKENAVSVFSHVEIIAGWMKADLEGSTRWLGTWQPDHVSAIEVFTMLGKRTQRDPEFRSPEIKQAVQSLVPQN